MTSKKRPKKVIFPLDLLSGKKRKDYVRGGIIMTSNFYDNAENIPSFEEIQKMDKAQARTLLTTLKTKYSNTELIKNHWKVSNYQGYKLLNDLGLTNKREEIHISTTKVKDEKEKVKRKVRATAKEKSEAVKEENIKSENNNTYENFSGFKIMLSGDYESGKLEERVLKLVSALDSNKKYNLKLSIEELP